MSDRERWARVAAMFDRMRELPPDERRSWLLRECADDDLRAEVQDMLNVYDTDPGFLESPVDASIAVSAIQERTEQGFTGRRIGAYRLVRKIGQGGMGVVYEGVRDDQEFERRVAVKLLPAAWSIPALADRFRFERRVLAGLDHPSIARLIDAGATEEGVPYLIMELVDGQRIDVWCREQRLMIRQRIELVGRVCEAVAYAHRNLVIHRDLKPANILVTTNGVPKLLDFGIATILSDVEGLSPDQTRTAQRSFTPDYASPEQFRGERVTTATDIYSLGVLTYTLLAERPPFALGALSPIDAMRTVCDVDPVLPSRAAPETARQLLRGDLDNIVLKAMRKEAGERYRSVSDFAADAWAWLEGRPVSASPATWAYQARKFVARHKLATAGAVALVASIAAGAGATAWQARIARQERDKAESRFRQVREFSRSLLFEIHESLRALPGATEPRRLLLDRAVQFLDGLAADAAGDAGLKLELAEGYRQLGRVQGNRATDNVGDLPGATRSFQAAGRLADEALAISPGSPAAEAAIAGAYDDLSSVLLNSGQREAAEQAHARHRQAVEQLERGNTADPVLAVSLASNYLDLGYFRGLAGDLAGAKPLYEKAVRLYESLPASNHDVDEVTRSHARVLQRLGALLVFDGQLDAGEARYRQALALDEALVQRSPGNAPYRYNLTFSLTDLGLIAWRRSDLATAESLYSRALQIRQDALDADPTNVRMMAGVSNVRNNLAGIYLEQQRYADAVAARRAAMQLIEKQIAVKGPVPDDLSERVLGQINLAEGLLHLAAAARIETSRTAAIAEARHLIDQAESSLGHERGEWTGNPELRQALSEQKARLLRLAP